MNPQHKLNRQRNRLHRLLRQLTRATKWREDAASDSTKDYYTKRVQVVQTRVDELLISGCSYTPPDTNGAIKVAIVESTLPVA